MKTSIFGENAKGFKWMMCIVAASVMMMAGCDEGKDGVNALVSASQEEAGDNCANGGVRVSAGLDENGNNILEMFEISSTQFICNGTNGVNGSNGQNGSNGSNAMIQTVAFDGELGTCTYGGVRVNVLIDGVLQEDLTEYVCNGVDGLKGNDGAQGVPGSSALVSVSREVGNNCPANIDGVRLQIGLDQNGNGTLDSDEVTSTQYVCNGENGNDGNDGASVTVETESFTDNQGGCTDGGIKLTITNGETTTDKYVCNGVGETGSNGHNSLFNVSNYSGAQCLSGVGIKIESGLDANDNGELDANEITITKYVCDGVDGNQQDPCQNLVSDAQCTGGANGGLMTCTEANVSTSTESVVCTEHSVCQGIMLYDINATATACYVDPCAGVTSDAQCTGGANGGRMTCAEANLSSLTDLVVCTEDATCAGIMKYDATASATACADPCEGVNSDALCIGGANGGPVTCAEANLSKSTDLVICNAHATCANVMVFDATASAAACKDPCEGVTSDAQCTGGANSGPITCSEAGLSTSTGLVVCNAHATCQGVMVYDATASATACTVSGTTWDHAETWTGLVADASYTSSGQTATFVSQDVAGLTWTYSGKAETNFDKSDVKKGILMNKETTRNLDLAITNGIGAMEFVWGRGGYTAKMAPKVKISTDGTNFNEVDSTVCTLTDMTETTADPQTATCNINRAGTFTLRITPNNDGGKDQVIIGDVKWNDYQ